MRILPICKTPSVLPQGGKSSSPKEGASPLCRCATSLLLGRKPLSHSVTAPLSGEPNSASPERGGGPRQRWRGKLPQSCRKAAIQLPQGGSQPSLSLRDISPKGRDKFGLCVRQKVIISVLSDWSMCARTGYEMRRRRAGSQLTICKYTAQNGVRRIWEKRGFRRYVM